MARTQVMARTALAAAHRQGWRVFSQFAISSAIPVEFQEDGVHLPMDMYKFVWQHIAHYNYGKGRYNANGSKL